MSGNVENLFGEFLLADLVHTIYIYIYIYIYVYDAYIYIYMYDIYIYI